MSIMRTQLSSPCGVHAKVMAILLRAGNWVLLEGVDATITKTATIVPEFLEDEVHVIRPLQFHTQVLLGLLAASVLLSQAPCT